MNKHKILLVEDSAEIQILIKGILQRDLDIVAASTVAQAELELSKSKFSLIVLDVELPDGDGFDLCTKIKLNPEYIKTPVIFLTNKSEVKERVLGFTLGAEDYIVKPIEPLEFKARIDARLRISVLQSESNRNYEVGSFRVDTNNTAIYLKDEGIEIKLSLTHLEFKLLFYFIKNSEKVVSRERILADVWGQDSLTVTDRTIDSHIYTIRKKLGRYGSCIESVPKEGYKFNSQPQGAQNSTQ